MTNYTAVSQSGDGPFFSLAPGDSLLVPAGVSLQTLNYSDIAVTATAYTAQNPPGGQVVTVAGTVDGQGYFYDGIASGSANPVTFVVTPTGSIATLIYVGPFNGAPYVTLINQGTITGYFEGAYTDLDVENAGVISVGLYSTFGTTAYGPAASGTITNSGSITSATGSGIKLQFDASSSSVSITNTVTGTISSAGLTSPGIALTGWTMLGYDLSAHVYLETYHQPASVSIDNAGVISDGIYSDESLLLRNDGSISGNLNTDDYLNVVNYGAMFTGFVGYGAVDLTNLGSIYGNIGPALSSQPPPGALHVDNSGTIDGSIDEGSATGRVLIHSPGVITGSLTTGAADDYVDLTGGTIGGPVSLGEGNNVFIGGSGPVQVTAGSGNDILYAASGPSFIDAGGGNDTLVGGASNDTLYGGPGNDMIVGGAGDNVMAGGDGNDTIQGGPGNDFIVGDAGDDILSGGGGYNAFAYQPGFGHDIISDFNTVGYGDHIWFEAGTFPNFAAVQAAEQQVGTAVVITATAADSITLSNTTIASLTADHFIFGS